MKTNYLRYKIRYIALHLLTRCTPTTNDVKIIISRQSPYFTEWERPPRNCTRQYHFKNTQVIYKTIITNLPIHHYCSVWILNYTLGQVWIIHLFDRCLAYRAVIDKDELFFIYTPSHKKIDWFNTTGVMFGFWLNTFNGSSNHWKNYHQWFIVTCLQSPCPALPNI